MSVRKGFTAIEHGLVHYRVAGRGPPVVLLHDSPRSSAMYVALLEAWAADFTVYALDTPGYGHSTPLPDSPCPQIADYARALAATLTALGIERCPIYGFHTSSKITLQFAIDHPERVSLAIMDGLNLPAGGPNEEFIQRYMKPFVVSDDGSHLAATWSRARDTFRFFPWFDHTPGARLTLDFPDDAFLHGYVLDMLSAGASYSAAYSAAMRYLALPQIPRIRARAVFMCRRNDPLYPFLDVLPQPLPRGCTIERLDGDPLAWRARLRELLLGASGESVWHDASSSGRSSAMARAYLDLPHGQLHLRRYGDPGAPPLLLLPEAPGSSVGVARLATQLAERRFVHVLDWPGTGESDPLPEPSLEAFAAAQIQTLDALGLPRADFWAEFNSGVIALAAARSAPQRVRSLVLDGTPALDAAQRNHLRVEYCPRISVSREGSHLLALWQRLRDQQLCWPWFERTATGIRRPSADLGGDRLHALTTDLARQLGSYGDAAIASFEVDSRMLARSVSARTVMLREPADVRSALQDSLAPCFADVARLDRGESPERFTARVFDATSTEGNK